MELCVSSSLLACLLACLRHPHSYPLALFACRIPLHAHVRIQDQINMEMYSFKNLAARDEVKASDEFVSLVKILWGVVCEGAEQIDEARYKLFLQKWYV